VDDIVSPLKVSEKVKGKLYKKELPEDTSSYSSLRKSIKFSNELPVSKKDSKKSKRQLTLVNEPERKLTIAYKQS